jgi:hypothetical protein
MTTSRFVIFAAMSLGLCLPAAAQPSVQTIPLGATSRFETLDFSQQNVALLPGGGFAAAWTETSPGLQGDEIRMQWVRPDGTLVFPAPGRLISAKSAPVHDAGLVAGPHGGAFVAYQRYEKIQDLLFDRLVVQKIDREGHPVWPGTGIQVVTAAQESETFFSLLPDSAEGLFVCFTRNRNPAEALTEIACQRFDASGRRLWPAGGLVAGGVAGWKVAPRVLPDGHGGILVVWSNQGISGRKPAQRIRLEGQRISAGGERLWGNAGRTVYPTRLPAAQAFSIPPFEAVPDGAGGAVLALFDRPAGVVALRVDSQGRSLWTRAVEGSKPPFQSLGGLVAGPEGGAFVAVYEFRRQDGAFRTYLYRLDGAGRQLWSEDGVPLLEPDDPNALVLGMRGSADGGRLRVVTSYIPHGHVFDVGIRGVVLDLDGHRLNGPTGTPLSDETHYNRLPQFVFDPARGQGLAVWEAFRSTDANVLGALWRDGSH